MQKKRENLEYFTLKPAHRIFFIFFLTKKFHFQNSESCLLASKNVKKKFQKKHEKNMKKVTKNTIFAFFKT